MAAATWQQRHTCFTDRSLSLVFASWNDDTTPPCTYEARISSLDRPPPAPPPPPPSSSSSKNTSSANDTVGSSMAADASASATAVPVTLVQVAARQGTHTAVYPSLRESTTPLSKAIQTIVLFTCTKAPRLKTFPERPRETEGHCVQVYFSIWLLSFSVNRLQNFENFAC